MKKFLVIISIIFLSNFVNPLKADEDIEIKEYKLKAAFMFNFMKFTEWPKDCFPKSKTPIKVVFIGSSKYKNIFSAMTKKKVNDRNIEQLYIKDYKELDSILKGDSDNKDFIKTSHMLFISKETDSNSVDIIDKTSHKGLLVITENPDLLHKGSMIDFLKFDGKISFDINLINCNENNIQIRSSLVRLAKKVIKPED